ncbi:hypothetical protein [Azospirillum sp. sgz302134]
MFERQLICDEIVADKYAQEGEKTPCDIHARVLGALLEGDPRRDELYEPMKAAMDAFEMLPAGRILAGAGSRRNVTWFNCFVNEELEDSMQGIIGTGLLRMSITLQRGGGMGTDFSPVRPKGALVKGTGTRASGVVSFMHPFDSTGETVESAGERRGAQIATLRIDHPDIEMFIDAKRSGKLTGMNLSVLVTDDFMNALKMDGMFDLGHEAQPFSDADIVEVQERNGKPWYVYPASALTTCGTGSCRRLTRMLSRE